MDIGSRIKELRLLKGLTQTEFGDKIGLKQAVIGQIENGTRKLTDRNASILCDKFNVRHEWLRTGTGEMFDQTETSLVSKLTQEYNLDAMDQAIVEAYIQLPAEYRKGLNAYLSSLSEKLLAADSRNEQSEEPVDNTDLIAQARQMVSKAEEMRRQSIADQTSKKNA